MKTKQHKIIKKEIRLPRRHTAMNRILHEKYKSRKQVKRMVWNAHRSTLSYQLVKIKPKRDQKKKKTKTNNHTESISKSAKIRWR